MTRRTDLLRPADIARLAGVDSSTVANWRRRHEDFPPAAAGTERLFDRDAVIAWLHSRDLLQSTDPVTILREGGVRDLEPFALEVAAIAAIFDGTTKLSLGGSLTADLSSTLQPGTPDPQFLSILGNVIELAQKYWATSNDSTAPLFPLLSQIAQFPDRLAVARLLLPQLMDTDRADFITQISSNAQVAFAKFILDTVELPATGHLLDLGAGSGIAVAEAGRRSPELVLTAISANPTDARLITLRAIALGVEIRVEVGDLATAERIVASAPPQVLLNTTGGVLGSPSIRAYDGGFLAEADYSLAALLAAGRWLAPNGFAAIGTDQKAVSDLPDYLRVIRDTVLLRKRTSTIVALPTQFQEISSNLWIFHNSEYASNDVSMIDARTANFNDEAYVKQLAAAARWAWSEEPDDFDTWDESEIASLARVTDLTGSASTVEPGYWAPPRGHSDWSEYGEFYWPAAVRATENLLAFGKQLDSTEPLAFGLRGPETVGIRLDVLCSSGAASLTRAPANARSWPLRPGLDLVRSLSDFAGAPEGLTHPEDPLIAEIGDVIFAIEKGALYALPVTENPIPVGRGMWLAKVDEGILDARYLAMTANSGWGQRVSRLVDPKSRNNPGRIEIALSDIETQRVIGSEYERLSRLRVTLSSLATEAEQVLELYMGRTASGPRLDTDELHSPS